MTNERVGKEASATWWPKGGMENSVVVAQQPMRDRKNRSGWCIGTKVERLVKDVMETQSCEYGFILSG